jgi:hypothetical protein
MPLTIRRRLVDRVRQLRKIAYALCLVLVVLAVAAAFISVSSPAVSIDVAIGPTFFDGDRALRLADEMWRGYPERSLGSEGAANVVDWMRERLSAFGTPLVDEFTTTLGDRQVTLHNVAVVLQGVSKETIVVAAPRDTPAVVKVDPLQYSSGAAVLMELAQVFSARPHQKTLAFLSTEDTGAGSVGLARFLDSSDLAPFVTVTLCFDKLGRERAKGLEAAVTAPRNTTPGWYVQLTRRVLAKSGLGLNVPGLFTQAAQHTLSLSRGDQVAGLERGIPSLRLYDEGAGNPTAAGLSNQGAALERLLLSLDTSAETPPDPGTALLLESGRFLTGRAITFLAFLMLLPTLTVLFIWLFYARLSVRGALMHLRNLLSFVLPFGLVALLALLLSFAGLIPRYGLQVPTLPGPSTDPRVGPTLLLLLLGGALFLVSRHFLGYLRPREPRATTEMTRLCAGFLSLVIGLALLLAQSPFLLLPYVAVAWLWPLATCFAEPVYSSAVWRHRFTSNVPVLLAGILTPFLFYAYLASGVDVGWFRAWWFLLVQVVSGAYGWRGPLAVVFIASAFLLLLGVKRMRVIPVETLEATDELSLLELPPPRSRRRKREPVAKPPLSPWR